MEKNFSKTAKIAILLMILSTLFTSVGQILWKLGLIKINLNFPLSLINFPLLLGFVFYGLGFIFVISAFKRGELSILYPIVATSYVWVSILSPLIFPSDSMNVWKWAGIFVILLSVSLLGLDGTKKMSRANHG